MKQQTLSNRDVARICQELAVLLHAGVMMGDGLALLAQEEFGKVSEILAAVGRDVDCGTPLWEALENSGAFPGYMTGLLRVGERAGRTEQALSALKHYYEQREAADRQIRAALTYPSILLLLMLVVIVVLLSRVLPVFDEVYASLGGSLTGVAGGLLQMGRWLDAAMPVLCALLAAVVVLVLAFSLSGTFREKVMGVWRKHFGDRGISRRLNDARFAQVLEMGLASGLPLEEAVDLCGELMADVPAAAARCRTCGSRLAEGADLAEAMKESGMLPASACRLLALGLRSGSGDSVMEDIARRLSAEAAEALEDRVAQVEPTLVLVTSLLVGVILLSVMLPLMHIMSAIG